MKKIVALIAIFCLLFCFVACSSTAHGDAPIGSISGTVPQETTVPEDTTSTMLIPEKESPNLSAALVIERLKGYLEEHNLGSISNLETKPGKNAGQIVTSFQCVNELVSVSVTETNGTVDFIMSLCLPSQVIKVVPSDSLAEAAIGAYMYSMIPLFACEPEIENSWHQEQFFNAPDEGDSSIVIRSYTSTDWLYTAMVGEAVVTCVAARYCNQCKSNAPKVTFTSGSSICDTCNGISSDDSNSDKQVCPQCGKSEPDTTFYDDWKPGDVCFSCGYDNFHGGEDAKKYCSQCGADCTYRGLEEDGRCEDCHASDNTPSQPPETQPPETQPPAVCSHNYADATCTAPKTCTKCGATAGSAVGHTWKNATCTEPATCSTCHETWGSAKGHSWQEATCTAPKTCQTCKATEGSALPHNMYGTKCLNCDYTDFSEYALTSNTFCLDSWFYLGDGSGSQYLEDGEASINIDSKGVCKVSFDKYSYTFTLKQTDFGSEPVFECYMNGEPVKTASVTFYYSQNRCDFFLYGGALGFSQVALCFDM